MSDSVRPHRCSPPDSPVPGILQGVGCPFLLQCMKVKSESEVAQLCPTLCNPIDGSPPGSSVPGILQARTLEWVALSFSNAWKWKVKVKLLTRVQLLATPWTLAYEAPPSIGFPRQEYWSGVPLPSPVVAWDIFNCIMWTLGCDVWDLLPWPGMEPRFPSSALGVQSFSHWTTREVPYPLLLFEWYLWS